MKLWAGPVSPRAHVLGCRHHPLPGSSHGRPSGRVCVLLPFPMRTPVLLVTSLHPSPLFKNSVSKYSLMLRSWDYDFHM